MMMSLLLTPVILSLLVLAVHFLRAGNLPMVVVMVLLPGLLLVRRPWAARVLQAFLSLGAIIWVLTLGSLAKERMADGRPYVRMAVILGAVAAIAALSALAFQTRRLRAHFRIPPQEERH